MLVSLITEKHTLINEGWFLKYICRKDPTLTRPVWVCSFKTIADQKFQRTNPGKLRCGELYKTYMTDGGSEFCFSSCYSITKTIIYSDRRGFPLQDGMFIAFGDIVIASNFKLAKNIIKNPEEEEKFGIEKYEKTLEDNGYGFKPGSDKDDRESVERLLDIKFK